MQHRIASHRRNSNTKAKASKFNLNPFIDTVDNNSKQIIIQSITTSLSLTLSQWSLV